MRFKPKKKLGQHFLTDRNVRNNIISSCNLSIHETVLEIGPGRGEMTQLIEKKVKRIFAVEVDSRLCELLNGLFKNCPKVKIIHKDILKLDFEKDLPVVRGKIKVFGNIPYYISSPIIEHLLKFRRKLDSVYLTVQKEFAKRATANPGTKNYGSLSCFVGYFFEAAVLLNISRNCFTPVPDVDSSLIRLIVKENLPLDSEKERRFFELVRAAFCQRRKTLRNSLSKVISRDKLEYFFGKYNIDPDVRPERISLKDFINLAKL